MQLKYVIEAIETIESNIDLKPKQLTQLKRDTEFRLTEALQNAGLKLQSDIKLEFDLIGDDEVETWQ